MLLTGSYVRSLDDKQRLAVPKPLRESLGYPSNCVFYLAPGTDGSLAFFAEREFSRLAEQLDVSSGSGQDVRAFSRLFYSQAQRVEMDGQGRIRIPSDLAGLAALGREVVLIGVRDHLEIWNRDHWEEYLARQQKRYDEIAETALAQSRSDGRDSGRRQEELRTETGSRPTAPR